MRDPEAAPEKSMAAEPLGKERAGWQPRPGSERILRSPLLDEMGANHGFTTRLGGVSQGRFATLNLGQSWGDEPAHAEENLQRVAREAGFATAQLCQVIQVHGTTVVPLTTPERRRQSADGMVSGEPLVLSVLSADCVSILLADGEGRVGAVHAGWRGTVAGVATQAVDALVALGARRDRLRAVLGPSIGPCCFEVQEDVAARFAPVCPASVQRRDGRLFVDLWRTNSELLRRAGLLPAHVDAAPPCTRCDSRRFYSYRRDGAGIGQHLAFIVGGTV
jgi:YfiH family protein